jgi:hypothetical protein
MPEVLHRSFFIAGPAGRLEAMLWTAAAENPPFVAVVCHPHPLFGGTMHNKVVFQAAKALHRFGIPVLRFNFRGAGMSEGVHDRGRGEQDDVRAAINHIAGEFPGRPIVVAGFSFGSSMGLRVGCQDARVVELIGLGIPVNDADFSFLKTCEKPRLIIVGDHDRFAAQEKVEELFAVWPEPKRLVIVKDADHFFTGKLGDVSSAIGAWLAERWPSANSAASPDS